MYYFLLAIIQGISEFLPISSTGHLNLAQHLFKLTPSLSLDIFLHIGTLIAVLFFFRNQIKYFFSNIFFIVLASVPAALVGILFKSQISNIFSSISFLPYFFLITSILLFSTKFIKVKNNHLSIKNALIIGLFQALAILPGVSRSGATITAGLLMGLSPLEAFNFSFCLFIPATLGAVLLDYKNLTFSSSLLLPLILTILVGLVSLNILKNILISKNFWKFGIYTLILAIILFFML